MYVRIVQTGWACYSQARVYCGFKHSIGDAEELVESKSTTTNWPLIILGLPSLFLEMRVYRLLYHSIFILICPNIYVMRNVSRLCLRAHSLKVEAAARLEGGSRICNQCPGEDEHVQNEVHALLFCQDHRVCELWKHSSSFSLHLILRTFQQPVMTSSCISQSTRQKVPPSRNHGK